MKVFCPKSRGFSLIELLVVITIISLLTGVILTSISGSRAKARDSQRVSDLGQLQLALALYLDRCNSYPSSLVVSTNNGCPSGITLGSYIGQIQTPPAGAGQAAYDYATLCTSSCNSVYVSYVLHAKLESTNVASSRALNGVPAAPSGYAWSSTPTCNLTTDYCVSPN